MGISKYLFPFYRSVNVEGKKWSGDESKWENDNEDEGRASDMYQIDPSESIYFFGFFLIKKTPIFIDEVYSNKFQQTILYSFTMLKCHLHFA